MIRLNLRPYGRYIQFGSQLGLSMALFIIAGYWLDEKFDTSPWLLLTGIFLGIVSSVWTVAKLVIELDMADKKKKETREKTDKTSADSTADN